jgi:hypothetical protein
MNPGHLADAIFLILVAFAFPFGLLCAIERFKHSRRQRLPKPEVRRHFDWSATGRNRAIRLPADADLGKIDPIQAETLRVETSIEISGAGFQRLSPDRRVTRAEFGEIMPEPNEVWARIGARHQDASLQSDDKAVDTSS